MQATKNYVESLDFRMQPVDGGQTVEVTYACDEDGLWCRTHDRSDRTTSYQFAKYHGRATEGQLQFEPQNHLLPRHCKWQEVSVR